LTDSNLLLAGIKCLLPGRRVAVGFLIQYVKSVVMKRCSNHLPFAWGGQEGTFAWWQLW